MRSNIVKKSNTFIFMMLSVLPFLFLQNCSNLKQQPKTNNEDLMNADKAFSKLSQEKGMKFAFLEFAANDAVLLRANSLPLEGKNAIAESFKEFSDTGLILTWEPQYADIALSGELGYTYGIFTSIINGPDGNKIENKGTYVSIWKKDEEGNWKFVLDTGNEGLGE